MADLTWETFNPENKKLILSLDGGGMRGIIPLTMLVYLEKKLNKPAYEIFDMVAGTSTGAIIAAGLALGYSAEYILENVYRTRLPGAFGNRDGVRFWLRYLFRYGLRYQYSWKPFILALSVFEGTDKTLGETYPPPPGVKRPILLMTTKDLRTTNTYYMVNAGAGRALFADWPLKGAVTASSAASLFFRPVDGNLVDGGVGAFGNPCLAAATEAFEFISNRDVEAEDRLFDPERTILISLGTGHVSTNLANQAGYTRGITDWLSFNIIGGIVEAAVQQALNTRAIYGNQGLDFRRFNVNLTKQAVRDVLGVPLGNLDPQRLTLDTTSAAEIALMEKIGTAYADIIDWTLPDQLPWANPRDGKPPAHTKAGQPRPQDPSSADLPPIDWESEARTNYGDEFSRWAFWGMVGKFLWDTLRSPSRWVLTAVLLVLPIVLMITLGVWGVAIILGVVAVLGLLGVLGAFG